MRLSALVEFAVRARRFIAWLLASDALAPLPPVVSPSPGRVATLLAKETLPFEPPRPGGHVASRLRALFRADTLPFDPVPPRQPEAHFFSYVFRSEPLPYDEPRDPGGVRRSFIANLFAGESLDYAGEVPSRSTSRGPVGTLFAVDEFPADAPAQQPSSIGSPKEHG